MLTIDTDNKEFQDAFNLVRYTRQSIFLTGKAGTGKSTFLKYICENTKKKHIVLAPTGIAAIQAGGSTLHSFFKLPFHPLLPDDPRFSVKGGKLRDFLKYNTAHCKLIKEVELVIIDEISMVRADIIDFIDRILRVYSHNMREPFGGKQLLLVGDVYQLEPVIKNEEREILNRFYPTPYFFSAHVFQEMELVSVELKKVYRQTDAAFIRVLDRIRTNVADATDLQLLNGRAYASIRKTEQDMYITLATRRDQVDYINEKKLAELPGDPVVFKGEIQGEFPANSLPTSMQLELKPGAQIIFIKNDYDRRWVNGTIGTVSGMDKEGGLYVITEDGRELDVKKESWRNVRYIYNEEEKRIEEQELGVFIQYPIRLAWAITVHKSQGLTFSRAIIDFSGGVFAGGQAYVALSRCTSLEGIQLTKPITRTDIFVRPEIIRFATQFNNRQAIEKAMKQAQADIQYMEALKEFDNGNFEGFLDQFFKAIHSRYDLEKPLVKRFMRKKLHTINSLKAQNEQLKLQLQTQKKNLQRYAEEYYRMGNECMELAQDARAALANYEKALEMDPLHVKAYIGKGIILHDRKAYLEAAACFNQAVKLSPRLCTALFWRGKNKLALNENEEALHDLEDACLLDREDAGVRELLGDAYARLGRLDEASVQWDKAEELRLKRKKKKRKGKKSDTEPF